MVGAPLSRGSFVSSGMDRRGFLRLASVGGTLAVAAPRLILPAARKVAESPERRIFLPPVGGRPWAPASLMMTVRLEGLVDGTWQTISEQYVKPGKWLDMPVVYFQLPPGLDSSWVRAVTTGTIPTRTIPTRTIPTPPLWVVVESTAKPVPRVVS